MGNSSRRPANISNISTYLEKGEKIPFDPKDATIYYVGPTPAKPGAVIGSAGPTTSGRMDAYAPTMMSVGARGMIGKGARLPEVVEAMLPYFTEMYGNPSSIYDFASKSKEGVSKARGQKKKSISQLADQRLITGH